MKASNPGGSSGWSDGLLTSPLPDLSEVPLPTYVELDTVTGRVEFGVPDGVIPLLAVVEDGGMVYTSSPLRGGRGVMVLTPRHTDVVTLKLCLVANATQCSTPVFAKLGKHKNYNFCFF